MARRSLGKQICRVCFCMPGRALVKSSWLPPSLTKNAGFLSFFLRLV